MDIHRDDAEALLEQTAYTVLGVGVLSIGRVCGFLRSGPPEQLASLVRTSFSAVSQALRGRFEGPRSD